MDTKCIESLEAVAPLRPHESRRKQPGKEANSRLLVSPKDMDPI